MLEFCLIIFSIVSFHLSVNIIMKKFLISYFLLLASILTLPQISFSQQSSLEVYPSNWWVGMKWNKVQLMVHETNHDFILAVDKLVVNSSSPDLKIIKINKVENKRYLFIDVAISPNAKPQTVIISFGGIIKNEWRKFSFELKPRLKGNGTQYAQGVTSKDFIYLLMPDRFSNADTTNDKIEGMQDQSLDRSDISLRHGGDLQGVINHLDYLKDLGVTTLWMTPVLENDMRVRTEHGYAITNYYRVDPRLGTNDLYKKLSDELHKRGMKLIQDAVYNHMGLYNFLQEDPPMKDWVHQWLKFTRPIYKEQTSFDPHVAQVDKVLQSNGWFDHVMPDLNQANRYVANYLIQNAIWCVEEFGVDGWRIDTYTYCDPLFMNRCNKALMDEYPHITMFGEVWTSGAVNQAYFGQNNLNTSFKSNLIGVTDFQALFDGIYPALKQGNWNNLYQNLSYDILYKNPMNNVIFLDNHDITRFYSEVGEDIEKLKMGLVWLLTERGIPQLYYGTEILMKGIKNPDGYLRLDFPGGWKDDKQNKFTSSGRTDKEEEVFEFARKLANFRKNSPAITNGKMIQYVPLDSVYVYFRYSSNQTIMIAMNMANESKNIMLKRFEETTKGFNKMKNILTGEINDLQDFSLDIKTAAVFELIK
jgi:glycosidase